MKAAPSVVMLRAAELLVGLRPSLSPYLLLYAQPNTQPTSKSSSQHKPQHCSPPSRTIPSIPLHPSTIHPQCDRQQANSSATPGTNASETQTGDTKLGQQRAALTQYCRCVKPHPSSAWLTPLSKHCFTLNHSNFGSSDCI